jgi:hypothetical protein
MRVRYGPAVEGEFVEVAKADDAVAGQERRFPPVGRAGLSVRVTQVQPGRWKERRITGGIGLHYSPLAKRPAAGSIERSVHRSVDDS